MAWEISISAEGWDDIARKLRHWPVEDLAAALAETDTQAHMASDTDSALSLDSLNEYQESRKAHHAKLPSDTLAQAALDQIRETNTCDNGGHAYWIDPEGFWKVEPGSAPESPDEVREILDTLPGPRFDRFDTCEAWKHFATDYHGGQSSDLYAVHGRLDRMGFRLSILREHLHLISENGRALYWSLVLRYLEGDLTVRAA